MWNLVLARLEIMFVSVQDRCMVCAKCTIGSESFWTPMMVLLGTRIKWKLDSVYLKIVLILTQDGCTVLVKRTAGSEIILGAPDGTPRLRGSCGILFLSIWRQC
jgi:uncharacterized membrane protein